MAPQNMNKSTFETFRTIVYEKAGISLSPNKVALVEARVGKRMRELKLSDHNEYLDLLMNDSSGNELVHLLNAISTNVTSFFRESAHFDIFGSLIDDWRNSGQRHFRFWCAAASTGEEPYTIAMVIAERMGIATDTRILATDISTRVLAQCKEGTYSKERIEPVPAALRKRYFDESDTPKGPVFTVKQELKRMLTFARLNLSTPPFPMEGPFDAVFCRNVMIYFDNTVRKRLLDEICRLLKPKGYLFVGHAESLTGILTGLKTVKPSVYIKA